MAWRHLSWIPVLSILAVPSAMAQDRIDRSSLTDALAVPVPALEHDDPPELRMVGQHVRRLVLDQPIHRRLGDRPPEQLERRQRPHDVTDRPEPDQEDRPARRLGPRRQDGRIGAGERLVGQLVIYALLEEEEQQQQQKCLPPKGRQFLLFEDPTSSRGGDPERR